MGFTKENLARKSMLQGLRSRVMQIKLPNQQTSKPANQQTSK